MSTNLIYEINEVLKGIEKYWINEKLAKQMVIDDLRNNDIKLISKLLSNKSINETYVQDIDGYKILDKEALISTLRYKNYWQDSYTKYANKIGLTTEGKYLNYNSDVVLDFPFKDCLLEGGMTTEENVLKNNEKFYNQIIAKEEIDTLLSPKVLKNVSKFNKDGKFKIENICDNDNLILKGNNLVALYSLKKVYKNKIKLIYIDPPYNTGKDGFKYNDNFNHASWLTFMKNRLEVAWELLSEDGIICISIDDFESHYLKVLADNIFGRENFLNEVIWQRAYAPINLKKTFSKSHDTVLFYAKNNGSQTELNRIPRKDSMTNMYKNPDNDPRGPYKADNFSVGPPVEKNIYEITTPSGRKVLPPNGYSWRFSKERYQELLNENRVYFGKKGDSSPSYKRFLSEVKDGVVAQTLWTYKEVGHNQDAKKEIKSLFHGKSVFITPKPEKFIQRIITLASNEKDIVLDFFMGSGTTQAVAHKMNRQYIGIEQMDYINTVSVPRLLKVIEGEQGGISKDVKWQGGGSFVYAELAKENQKIVDKIISSNTKEELSQQIDNLLDNGVLNYEVDFNEFINTKKEFNELKLEEQKEVLIRILDSNQLYVNYSDIEDTAYNFSKDEIAFNHSFYGGE